MSLQPMIWFGNIIETNTARKAAMLKFIEEVEKTSGKKIWTDGDLAVKTFEELSDKQQEAIRVSVEITIQRNFSNTRTRSTLW
jgi:hypothetical protein